MSLLKGKKILVTGGAGFIGSNLCLDLVTDNTVVCLDNFITGKRDNISSLMDHPNFTLIEGDIREKEDCQKALHGVDIVLHQAALGSVPRSIENPHLTNSINIDGFLMMLDQARIAGVERFVYAASSSTYGDHPGLPKVEDKIGKPLSPYAVTKYVNELYANVYANLHGMKIIGLRYFNVFGQHQDAEGAYAAAIPKFIKAFKELRSPQIYGDGEQSRDFTYIKNVIQANKRAAVVEDEAALNQVYNVAFGSRITMNKLTEKLQGLLAKFDPAIGAIEIEYGPERKGDVKHSLASIEKAGNLLGYQPEYSVEAGLDEAIQWYWNYFNNK